MASFNFALRASNAGKRTRSYMKAAYDAGEIAAVGPDLVAPWTARAELWERLVKQEASSACHFARLALERREQEQPGGVQW